VTEVRISKDLQALSWPTDNLNSLVGNPRRGDVEAVKRSLLRFGQFKPIVARRFNDAGDEVNEVLMGNHTLLGMRELGVTYIAVNWEEGWTDVEAKAAAIADNHTSDLATNDDRLLADMLHDVQLDPSLLEATSYTFDDIEDLEFLLETPEIPGVSTADRKGMYEQAGIRTVVLPFPVSDYDRVARWLDLLRAEVDRDTNSEGIYILLEQRYGNADPAPED
jgi:hypothetical protein